MGKRLAFGIVAACLAVGPMAAQTVDPGADDASPGAVSTATETDALPEDFQSLHRDFLTDEDLQTDWPVPDPPEFEDRDTPGWLRGLADFLGDIFTALGPVFRVLFYIIVGLAVAGIVYFIFRGALESRFAWMRRNKTPKFDISVAPPFQPDAAKARSLLEEADALAAEGRFAEAVHLLLFRSIEDIQARRDGGVPASLTAREIAGLEQLPGEARSRLSPIIQIVERSFFGGRAVDGDGWKTARQSYEAFAFGGAWT